MLAFRGFRRFSFLSPISGFSGQPPPLRRAVGLFSRPGYRCGSKLVPGRPSSADRHGIPFAFGAKTLRRRFSENFSEDQADSVLAPLAVAAMT